ncbi:hypothetical protein DSM107133_00585 [Pseudosulfitobacter sp. DSM 107133]|nr:hypothetical protein DSM107133_00585 [Pseudosulfitobacter sp. DSM 107133]
MPLTFPLSTSDFMDELPIARVSFELPETVEMSRAAGGDLLTGRIGNDLWQGEVTLGRLTRAEARDALALVDAVRGPGRSFCAYHAAFAYPLMDPTGAILGAATPQIATLDTDTRLLSLKGLPSGYVLSRGDYLSFEYRTPVRYALHRIQEISVTANGSGVTPLFEVNPNIRPGAVTDTIVRLIKPFCKAVIVPGSVSSGQQTRFTHEGQSFMFQQTLGT